MLLKPYTGFFSHVPLAKSKPPSHLHSSSVCC